MSLSKIQNPWKFFLNGILLPKLAWLLLVPLSIIIPKKRKLVVFIGRDEGRFVDNVKYLYLHLHHKNSKDVVYYFLTENQDVFSSLKSHDLPVILYPRMKSFFLLLRAAVLVVDNLGWIANYKYHLLYRSKKVQLWHGAPLKKIGFDNKELTESMKKWIIRAYYFLKGRFPVYDLLISPSVFFTEISFTNAIKSKEIIESGYPRNEPMILKAKNYYMIGTDVDNVEKIKNLKKQGLHMIIYMPTFRDTGGDALSEKIIDLSELSQWGRENKVFFVFKFHSWERGGNPGSTEVFENIILYDNSKDIYPLFSWSDLLITDYSSIYLDYLVTGKPVLFFPYDLEKYMSKDREFYFDYDSFTPGNKCYTQDEMHREILNCLSSKQDPHKENRKKLRDLTFKYYDGRSSERIWEIIEEKFLK